MDDIILKKIEVYSNIAYYHFEVKGSTSILFRGNTLFIEFPFDISNIPESILSIPFVGAFGSLTWLTNSILWVPELDRSYYLSIKDVKQSFQEMHYTFPLRGRVIPAIIKDNTLIKSDKSILLFGGGVDAHCSYIRNSERIASIANIQGWFRDIDYIDKAANDDFSHCKSFAEEHSIDFLYVRSNFAYLTNGTLIDKHFRHLLHESWWHGFQHSQAFISIAIVLAYHNCLSNIIIGSSNTIGHHVACASDVTTDSMFRYAENGMVYHDAFEINRQQKMSIIVDYQRTIGKPYPLKVCSFNDSNCCKCEKCFRTIIEIIAEGGDIKEFGFNIDVSLKSFYENVMYDRLGLWGMTFEKNIYWNDTKERMLENYNHINDKEFVDWFLTFDFDKEKRKGLRRYYRTNFLSIIKRKLHIS